MTTFTHINSQGEANMVDVSVKAETVREARVEAIVTMSKETLSMIVEGKHHKGDVTYCRYSSGKRTWEHLHINPPNSELHPLLLCQKNPCYDRGRQTSQRRCKSNLGNALSSLITF